MTLITTQNKLDELAERLSHESFITVDTEFLREKTYYPQLCLLQLAGDGEAAMVDPLCDLDLSPIWALFENPAIVKVFHAARQDIEIFVNHTGKIPTPIFDTQIAAMVCGYGESVSYETLAVKLAGAEIDKSSRFTDWSLRPLSAAQLNYALADVTHLRTIYRVLTAELEASGRQSWQEQELGVLTRLATYQIEPETAWMRLKPRSNSPKFLNVFKALAAWRESEAQRRNLPRGRLIKDDAISEIASTLPRTIEALGRCRSVGVGVAQGRLGGEILAVVEAGLALPVVGNGGSKDLGRVKGESKALVDLLKVLLKHQCEVHEVAIKLVASVADLEELAEDDGADLELFKGWRREVFGESALALKHGKIALAIVDNAVKIVEI
ncbi:MAG: ribonuclease D [Candidatus Pacebacteria bacterium]|nr:ribonuclease D [Candidatus Paceibacterota bacterium]